MEPKFTETAVCVRRVEDRLGAINSPEAFRSVNSCDAHIQSRSHGPLAWAPNSESL